MPPAARVGDLHVCPMVTVLVPHVGGPILPPGCPTVLIGGLPAARATDMCVCVGPPDVIVLGSPTVLIGNMMAARMGDLTAHGGVITLGLPTVMIGIPGMGSVLPPSPGVPPIADIPVSSTSPPPPSGPPSDTVSKRVDKDVTETISNASAGNEAWNGTYGWKSKYTVTVDKANCTVTATIKIKVKGAITAAQKAAWKQAVEDKWNNKAKLSCTGAACPNGYTVSVSLQYVNSGADYEVTANDPGADADGRAGLGGTTSMTGWGVNDTTDITHEFGHMLGNSEEYFTTDGVDYSEGGTKAGFRDPDGGIMNNPSNDPLPRNYQGINDAAASALGGGTSCTPNAAGG